MSFLRQLILGLFLPLFRLLLIRVSDVQLQQQFFAFQPVHRLLFEVSTSKLFPLQPLSDDLLEPAYLFPSVQLLFASQLLQVSVFLKWLVGLVQGLRLHLFSLEFVWRRLEWVQRVLNQIGFQLRQGHLKQEQSLWNLVLAR